MPGFEIFGEEERREVQDVLDSGVLMRYGFDGARDGNSKTGDECRSGISAVPGKQADGRGAVLRVAVVTGVRGA